MRTLFLSLISCISLAVQGEIKLFLDFTINNPQELKQLDEAIRLGADLRAALNNLKKNGKPKQEISALEDKIITYEKKLENSYGLHPGLNYKMVATSGYIYRLIPIDKKDEYQEKGLNIKSDSEKVLIKNKHGEDIQCFKAKIRLLQKRESVIQFNNALKTSTSIKMQIASLEKQLKEKPEIGKKEEIQQGMKSLNEALKNIEAKMLDSFNVSSDGVYIFEPKTGAVYLALDKADLKKLSELNKARYK